jgi:hypothetical protein
MGPRSGLDAVEKRKITSLRREATLIAIWRRKIANGEAPLNNDAVKRNRCRIQFLCRKAERKLVA